MSDFVELRRVFSTILRRWWWVVLALLLGLAVGNIISRQQTPVFQARTTVLVGDGITATNIDRTDIQVSQAMVVTYVELARRQPVLQGVVDTLHLNESWQELSKHIQVNQVETTQLIEITVNANSPDMARVIADEMVNQLIFLSPTNAQNGGNASSNDFVTQQIKDIQNRIVDTQNRLTEINGTINTSISEIQLADLRAERSNLEGLLVELQRNYSDLLALTSNKRNPTQISVVESAHSTGGQIRPRTQLNTILGGILGALLAIGLIIFADFFDDTYKTLGDFSQHEEVNILGTVRRMRGRKLSNKIVTALSPNSPITEAYRIIRSRIRFKPLEKSTRSIMVTSSMPSEGTSVTAANLAIVFAQANRKTVLVDADFRRPVQHELFNVGNDNGLGDLLETNDMTVADALKSTSVDNLQILTTGTAPLDASERLGSNRMVEILQQLGEAAEIVIFDSPAALVYADAVVLSRKVDGVILVIQAGKSKRAAVTQTLLDLQNANANLMGSIFNQAQASDSFAANRAYIQERPLLLSPMSLLKRDRATKGALADLQAAARPLQETFDLPGEDEEFDLVPASTFEAVEETGDAAPELDVDAVVNEDLKSMDEPVAETDAEEIKYDASNTGYDQLRHESRSQKRRNRRNRHSGNGAPHMQTEAEPIVVPVSDQIIVETQSELEEDNSQSDVAPSVIAVDDNEESI